VCICIDKKIVKDKKRSKTQGVAYKGAGAWLRGSGATAFAISASARAHCPAWHGLRPKTL